MGRHGSHSRHRRPISSFPAAPILLGERASGCGWSPGGVRVECLEIHRSPGFPVLLGADYHTMALGNRSVSWNHLDDAHFAVLIEAGRP